jgi:hypothetical protein
MPNGRRQPAGSPLEVNKRPVPLFLLQAERGTFEKFFEIAVDSVVKDVPRLIRPGTNSLLDRRSAGIGTITQ